MFQRQLSTNALGAGSPPAQASPASSGPTGTSTPAAPKPPTSHAPRLFQRQMTASQLFSASSGSTAATSTTCGDKKRLLANVRTDLDIARSAANLTSAALAAQQQQPGARGSPARASNAAADDAPARKAPKNKRIISRMLSISAIHTSVGASNSGSGDSGPSSLASAALDQQSDEALGGASDAQRNSDKFDSSFRRSRSSSTSSTTGQGQQAQEAHAAATESIRCLAFVDATNQTLGGPALPQSSGSPLPSGSATVSAGSTGQAGAAGQVQSSAGANHKSLSPIDAGQQGAAQLALWLGTSAGSTLLVGLQMPDTEDNRVLQLQSVNAEPIPQASVKLPGQILCLASFICEARPLFGAQSTGGGGGSAGLGQGAGSQSSSLEGDTLMQSPSSSGSSGSATGAGGAPAAGSLGQTGSSSSASGAMASGLAGKPFHGGDSLDSRSSIFFALVSEKQARVYQVPANMSAALAGVQGNTQPCGHHHHSSTHTHHQSTSSPSSLASMPLADSPLAHLLANKRNLIAECELSESSFACCSQVVQMRSPEESCLVSYLANGNLVVHALPRLRPILMDADFVPYTHSRIAHSMRLSRNGHCLYQPSASEISKFTISAQYKSMVNEMLGVVWVPREMPEMPRTNFFKSLFSASQSAKQTDRDELFGECSAGKAIRGVAKHSGGQAAPGLDKLKGAAVGTMGHDMRVARDGLDERGEKLSEIEDRTLNMMNSAESYSQAAHQLAQKFKDKKWYQF